MSEIYRRIRERREALGYTQDYLAKLMGYKSRSSINKIEIGENDIPQSKIEDFAKALQTTPAYLMGWTNNPDASCTSESSQFQEADKGEGMSFGEQLKNARKAMGLTQKQLADALGAKHNSISNWENNQNRPDPDTIGAICGVLNISPNYLFENTLQIPPGLEPIPKMKRVPLLGAIACGEPILAEENLDGYVETPEEISADFSLRCKGDSMINARILDGDLVFIRQQPEVENGEIAAVLIDNEATLKRVYKRGDQLVLQPENPKYAPLVYTGMELEGIRILGKAVAFMSAVR